MTEQQLREFVEKINADGALARKVGAAQDPETYIAVAKEAGFAISLADLEIDKENLSEMELDSGGGSTSYPSQSCKCASNTACC